MWNYTEKVRDHYLHPRNVGEIENPDGFGEIGNITCVDALRLTKLTRMVKSKIYVSKHSVAEVLFICFSTY